MRWFILLAFNFAGCFALGFKAIYLDHHQGPSTLDISIGLPLALPLLAPVLYFHAPGDLIGVCFFLNPFVWALTVDWFLRRFVDPPVDASLESLETQGTPIPHSTSEVDR